MNEQKELRFIHISDTHFNYLPSMQFLDEERYIDNKFNTLHQAIDYAINNNIKLIVHTGDVFHTTSPSYSYMMKMIKELMYGINNGITFLIISGNHDQPKIKSGFNPLQFLDHIKGVHIFIKPGIFVFENVSFLAIPSPNQWSKVQTIFPAQMKELLKQVKMPNKVLVSHIQIKTIRDKSTDDIEPFIIEGIPSDDIPKVFNYVALGHVHRMQQIPGRPDMWYAGSSSQLSFNEENQEKYFLDVQLEGNGSKITPVKINNIYELYTLSVNVEKAKSGIDINKIVMYYVNRQKFENNMIRIILENCPDELLYSSEIDHLLKVIKDNNVMGVKILTLKKEIKIDIEQTKINENDFIGNIQQELNNYLKSKKLNDDEIMHLLELSKEINEKESGV
jgi:DNA repair exonuclease SbcCD nuclease subunit